MHEEPTVDEELDFKPKSRLPLIAFLLALAAGAGYLTYAAMTAVEPRMVLVAVRFDDGYWFDGSEASAIVADEIDEQLAALGFEPVRPGDPEVLALLEDVDGDLEKARRKLGAAFLISGALTTEVIEHPVEGGYFEVRVKGQIGFTSHDAAHAASTAVSGWAGAKEKDRARRLVAGGAIPQRAAAALIPELLLHPTLAKLLEGDATTVGKLAPAQRFVKARAAKLAEIAEAYPAHAARRQAQEKGPVPVTYHGDTAREDMLCGSGPAGYLVKTEDTAVFVSPVDNRERRISSMETLEWRAPGAEPTVLWTGYNTPNYPTVSADGGTVAICEDLFGWAKTITIVQGAETRRLRVDPKKRFSGFELSPDGRYVALYERPCRRCEGELVVLETAGEGAERFRARRGNGSFDGMTWLGATRLAVLHSPGAGEPDADDEGDSGADPDAGDDAPAGPPAPAPFVAERQTLWAVDLGADGPPTALYTVDEGTRLAWPDASRDGAKVAFSARQGGESGLLTYDVGAGAAKFVGTGGGTSAPRFSPDGQQIAFNWTAPRERDEEVAVLVGDQVTRLTDDPFRNRYPKYSADGRTIYFESLDRDPLQPKRHVSLIASVPAP